MPWLAANGIELRWAPAAEYATIGYFSTVAHRLRHRFPSDVVLLLDADTLIRRPLDQLIERVYIEQVLAGCIAHITPLPTGKLGQPSWAELFAACGLGEPRLEFEHTGWGYFFSEERYRYCPAYFNFGVIAAPSAVLARIGPAFETHLFHLRRVMESYFDAQLALTLAIAELEIPVRSLPAALQHGEQPLGRSDPPHRDRAGHDSSPPCRTAFSPNRDLRIPFQSRGLPGPVRPARGQPDGPGSHSSDLSGAGGRRESIRRHGGVKAPIKARSPSHGG